MAQARGSGVLGTMRFREIAGGSAGALTVTGIAVGDRLIAVVDTEGASANLASEFTITAANTIDNTGGTATTSKDLLVIWESYAGGRYEARFPEDGGRLNY